MEYTDLRLVAFVTYPKHTLPAAVETLRITRISLPMTFQLSHVSLPLMPLGMTPRPVSFVCPPH